MTHPLEAMIREAYAAFGRGDVDGYLRPCTEDFEFHVPGGGGIGGIYVGKDGLYDLARKAMQITGGTFHEEVEDVLATTSTPSCWRVTASLGTGPHGTIGPRMFMRSVTENWRSASSNLAIRRASMRLGDPLSPSVGPDSVGVEAP
jgi:SnoaL-like domain